MTELKKIKDISGAWKYLGKNQTLRPPSVKPNDGEMAQYFKTLLGSYSGQKEEQARERFVFSVTIETEEFEECLNKLKPKKASGVDQVSAEMIKYSDEKTRNKIREMMIECLRDGHIPQQWRDARIFESAALANF